MSLKRILFGGLLALFALPAFATNPTVVGSELTSTTATTTHTVNIPGDTCASGSLLVGVAAASDVTNDFTFGTGYNSIAQRLLNSEMGEVWYHECDGTETSTFSVTSSVSTPGAFIVYKVTGTDFTADPETTTTGGASSATLDPVVLTPTGGAKDYLWIIVGVQDENAGTFTSCPTNYTGGNCGSGGSGAGGGGSDEVKIAWSHRFNNATSEDPGVFTFSTADTWDAYTIAVHPASGVAASFTSGPSVAAASNGYTISGTLTGSGFGSLVAYAVGVAPGDGAPSCAQIKAGQNDGGTAALLSANETWSTGVGDSFALAAANKPPSMDVHVCGSDGTNNTSVTSFADQLRSARSGFALVTIASISATGICDYDSYFTPDCAVGDVFEYEDDTNENADCNVSIGTDGDITLTPVSGGECDGRPTFEISYEDVSSATDGLFTAPTVGNFTTDDTAYINNTGPSCALDPADSIVVLEEDTAMSSTDLAVFADCSDDDGDAISFSVTSGTLPNGTSLGGTGNKDWSGTPDTEDEAGEAITIQVCDTPGDCTTFDLTVYVVNTWTVPDLSGLDFAGAEAAIIAAAPWRENGSGLSVSGFVCDAGAENLVVTQDPAASAEAASGDPISVELSILCPSSTYDGERKVVYELSDVSGLTQWVDYIPVVVQVGCNAGTYDEDGCWAVTPLASTTGKVAWVDYTPVFVVAESVNKWRYENNGWIPVDTLTP